MYRLKSQEYINESPWLIPFSQRISKIFAAKNKQLKVALYLYEAPDTSTFRYRVYNVCQSLELSFYWRGVYFYQDELKSIYKYLDKVDLLVVVRFRWTFELDMIINLAKEKGIKVVFDIDDMVYNLEYLPIIVNTLSVNMESHADYDWWFAYISRINKTAMMCDAVITTNAFLAQKMEKDLHVKGYIIQNFINRFQEEISDNYFAQKAGMYSCEKFVIGYFSGTPSHINDFLAVAPELKALLEAYGDITLKLVGFMELPNYMLPLEDMGSIERVPLVNFLDLQKEIAGADVNIVPLVNNEFSNCKSELKFFEASMVGTVTCATPSYIFRETIKHGENGYLCERGKWFNALENLYFMWKKNYNTEVVKKARAYCKEHYVYNNQTTNIENVFNNIIEE
jgi:glycosyltransferase involved in cell wall biosynthesis